MNNLAYFPHTPLEDETTTTTTTSEVSESLSKRTSSSSRARARNSRVSDPPIDPNAANVWLCDIARYYSEAFGNPFPPVAKSDVIDAINAGLDPSLILRAIDEATMAPRPSWAYARAIIRSLVREGCLSEEAYLQRQSRWRYGGRTKWNQIRDEMGF